MGNPELAQLLDDVDDFFKRYVHYATPEQGIAVTLWTAYTHNFGFGQGNYSWVPYLMATSAEPMSGKTTLLTLVSKLCHEPLTAESVSAALLGRMVGGRTLLLDEVDGIYKGRVTDGDGAAMELRTILNAGFSKTGKYQRLEQTKGGAFEPREWSVYGPKMLVGIGRTVPDTVKSRSIRLRMQRSARTDPVQKARDRVTTAEAEPLKAGLVLMAQRVKELPIVDDLPVDLGARDADIWEPLIALADQASEDWGRLARHAATVLSESEPYMSNGIRVLSDIRTLFEEAGWPERLSTKEIIGRAEDPNPDFGHEASGLCAVEDFNWSEWSRGRAITSTALSKLLSEFDVESSREALGHGYGPSGYRLRDLQPIWERYL